MTPLFAAVDWLNISINLLLVIHVIICLLLALLVLMQRPKQEGLGAAFGSGLTDQAFGARTTDVLQKGTVYLGTLFFVVTLVLAILIGKQQNANSSMIDTASADTTEEVAPEVTPVIPSEKAPVVMPEVEKVEAPAVAEEPKKVEEPKKAEKVEEKKEEVKPAEITEKTAEEETSPTPEAPAQGDNQ